MLYRLRCHKGHIFTNSTVELGQGFLPLELSKSLEMVFLFPLVFLGSHGRRFGGVVVNSNQSKNDFDPPAFFLPAFLPASALPPYYRSEQLMIARMRQILPSVPCTSWFPIHRICLIWIESCHFVWALLLPLPLRNM